MSLADVVLVTLDRDTQVSRLVLRQLGREDVIRKLPSMLRRGLTTMHTLAAGVCLLIDNWGNWWISLPNWTLAGQCSLLASSLIVARHSRNPAVFLFCQPPAAGEWHQLRVVRFYWTGAGKSEILATQTVPPGVYALGLQIPDIIPSSPKMIWTDYLGRSYQFTCEADVITQEFQGRRSSIRCRGGSAGYLGVVNAIAPVQYILFRPVGDRSSILFPMAADQGYNTVDEVGYWQAHQRRHDVLGRVLPVVLPPDLVRYVLARV